MYLGCLVLPIPELDLDIPDGTSLTPASAYPISGSLSAFTPSPAVVEELQVQILKLLLDNKDDNGVSVSEMPLTQKDMALGPKTETAGAGSGSHRRHGGDKGFELTAAHHSLVCPFLEG